MPAIRLRNAIAVCIVAATLAACAPGDTSAVLAASHSEYAAQLVEEATAAGASGEQRALLADVAEDGRNLEYEEYASAFNAAMQCAEKAGLLLDGPFDGQHHGQATLSFGFAPPDGVTADQAFELADSCTLEHLQFVEMLYQSQPAATEFVERTIQAYRGPLAECLSNAGFPVDNDATIQELAAADQLVIQQAGEDASCYVTTGFNDAMNQ